MNSRRQGYRVIEVMVVRAEKLPRRGMKVDSASALTSLAKFLRGSSHRC